MKKFKFLLGIVAFLMLMTLASVTRWDGSASAQPVDLVKIAFISDRGGTTEVYVMGSDGSNQVNVSPRNTSYDYNPAWSPDGTQIAFNAEGEIYAMDADGSNSVNLTKNSVWDQHPSWSPDSSQIAFASKRHGNWQIYIMDNDGSHQNRITDNSFNDREPTWLSLGDQIAFVSDRDGNEEIYLMNSDGTNQTNLSRHPANDRNPAWSPDGTQIAFSSDRDDNDEVYVMNSNGFNQINLSQNPSGDWNPTWSPDGAQIAFASDRDDNDEVYVMNYDGSKQSNLSRSPANEWQPAWSPLLGERGLVITHRARLEARVGVVDWDELERMVEARYGKLVYLDELGDAPEPAEIDHFIEGELVDSRYGFVLILGGHEVVPFSELPNLVDRDTLYTDDPYADTDHDELLVPDLPLARMPDGGDFTLLTTQLSKADPPAKTGFSVAQPLRPFAEYIADLFGGGDDVIWSPPHTDQDIDSEEVNAKYDYFMLHGAQSDTGTWWGENPEGGYPIAFTVDQAYSKGVVLTGACHGAYILDRTAEESIALQFLASGARAFVGTTGIHYSGRQRIPERHGPVFHQLFVGKLVEGKPPLQAYFAAKQAFADHVQDPTSHKILHEFIYLGAP